MSKFLKSQGHNNSLKWLCRIKISLSYMHMYLFYLFIKVLEIKIRVHDWFLVNFA